MSGSVKDDLGFDTLEGAFQDLLENSKAFNKANMNPESTRGFKTVFFAGATAALVILIERGMSRECAHEMIDEIEGKRGEFTGKQEDTKH